jgi:hypothetical protein
MAYLHRWSVALDDRVYADAWPTIVADTWRIIDVVRRRGIVIAGREGFGRPTLDVTDGVAFNGDATTDLDGEAFVIPPPAVGGGRHQVAFCRTNRKPYDLAVASVLLRLRLLLPGLVMVASDGAWDHEWCRGSHPRVGVPGARTLVGGLFGAVPAADPLHAAPLLCHSRV